MKPDIIITMGTYYGGADYIKVHGASIIGAAILTYYHGETPRNHDEDDTICMDLNQFKSFKEYCFKASANKFELIINVTV